MNAQDVIAEAVLSCKPLAARYFAGFTEENRAAQAANLPNHFAWSLGHCAVTMHRAAEKIDGRPLPETDFGAIAAEGAAGCDRFLAEHVAFGSRPSGEGGRYPSVARCVEIYEGACDRLAAAVRGASEAKLEEMVRWGPAETTLRALALRMVFHNGMHVGQIADLRRGLGFRSILG